MSKLPKFTMSELIEAGVHFGHKTMRWNPAMAPYIYGERNGIHIIDLQKTVPMLHRALKEVYDVSARNGRILFVSTKRQASEPIAAAAQRCGQYFVNHRWLGGMLTNWGTISQSIKTLHNLQEQLADTEITLSKKERLQISRKIEKLEKALGGIKEMGGKPDLIFVIDINREDIAIAEANKLGIPVVAIADSNVNPAGVDFLVPGNDDAIRSVDLYCNLVAETVLSGIQAGLKTNPKVDAGESLNPQETTAKAGKTPAKKTTDKKEAVDVEVKKKPAAKKADTAKEGVETGKTNGSTPKDEPKAKKESASKPSKKEEKKVAEAAVVSTSSAEETPKKQATAG